MAVAVIVVDNSQAGNECLVACLSRQPLQLTPVAAVQTCSKCLFRWPQWWHQAPQWHQGDGTRHGAGLPLVASAHLAPTFPSWCHQTTSSSTACSSLLLIASQKQSQVQELKKWSPWQHKQCNCGVDVHTSWFVTTDRCQYFPPPISCSKIFSRWRSSTLTQFFSSLPYIFFEVVTRKTCIDRKNWTTAMYLKNSHKGWLP